jgi:Holliday junction resolvase-like predicted endonuclease
MRSMLGFSELRKRFADKQPKRASYFEILTAKQFLKQGFEIYACPEVGRRGEDFDFTAKQQDIIINVEVTALTGQHFSKKSIANSLQNKRDQVPNTAPAILYCVLPERWTLEPNIDWDHTLQTVTEKFFSSKRWNAVVFWIEQHVVLHKGPGAAMFLVRKPYVNETARHTIDLNFLFGGKQGEPMSSTIADDDKLEELRVSSYDSEFFRWIDSLVPQK